MKSHWKRFIVCNGQWNTNCKLNIVRLGFLAAFLGSCAFGATSTPRAAPWREPTDISSRNLYYGPGGRAHQPQPPFRFIEEDMSGTSPKIVVKDRRGITWVAKFGAEARPETV